jgi:hypothetical protein
MATPAQRKSWTRWTLILGSLIGIGLRAYFMAEMPRSALSGADFPVFYAGGRLAGTPELYSSQAVDEIQLREMGFNQPPAQFCRLPFFAAFMIPWAKIPFWTSFWLWRAVSILAAVVFIWLWPAPWEWSLLACAWSLPLAFDITNGQDSAFLLIWVTLAFLLLSRGYDFAAGLALAMCAPKFHLFLLAPLLMIGRRRMAYGLAAGGAVLAAICFAVQGLNWPAEFLRAIHDPSVSRAPARYFNLWGMAHGNTRLEMLLAIPVVAATWYIVRHTDLELGLAAVISGSLLVSHHISVSDIALMIPAGLIIAFHPLTRHTKVIAVFLLTPLAYFMIESRVSMEAPRALLLGMVFLLAWEVRTASGARSERPESRSESMALATGAAVPAK